MKTKVEPTVEKWVESIKQTCFDCIDYDGETVTWQSVLDKYLTEIVSEIKSLSVQEAKAEEREKWLKAVVNQPPVFMKVGSTLEDGEQARRTRRARCVEILREVGETKAADDLLTSLRKGKV